MPALFRRRTVWLPTAWGMLAATLLIVVGLVAFARWIGGYLAPTAPAAGADGRGAQTLIVEGWLNEDELAAAVDAFRRGHYERVIVSGGPNDTWAEGRRFATFAERAADYLRRHGLGDATLVAVPAPSSAQERTYLSAVVVRDWARSTGTRLGAIDLFSSGVHARRSLIVFRMAFGPAVEIGVLAAEPRDYDETHWWTTSTGAKSVLGEAISVAWTRCCFWPAPHGTFAERWAIPEPRR